MADKKFRTTRQRRVILEELQKVKSHPTADEVYEMVRRRLPRISLGTVYRNLDILAANGAILKLQTAGTQRRFDGNVGHHYHVRCVRCGRIEDVAIGPIAAIENAFRKASTFDILGHRLECTGLCPKCRAASRNARRKAGRKGTSHRKR